MESVYIETSIPSYYLETRRSPEILLCRAVTRRWWKDCGPRYRLCSSRFVLAELERAPATKAEAAMALMRGVPLLEHPPELESLADYYIEQRAMPREAAGDAYHLALASLHRVGFLLTWNCRHLANANKIRHLTVLNRRMGLPTPVITTPFMLLSED